MTKVVVLIFALILRQVSEAEEYRYIHKECTGITDVIIDRDSKETSIAFAPDSDRPALLLVSALLKTGICGTRAVDHSRGVTFDQEITFIGEFASGVKLTAASKETAQSEPYRDFRLTDVKVVFPIAQYVVAQGGNPIDGPITIRQHFSFATLFPDGVSEAGIMLDLTRYTKVKQNAE